VTPPRFSGWERHSSIAPASAYQYPRLVHDDVVSTHRQLADGAAIVAGIRSHIQSGVDLSMGLSRLPNNPDIRSRICGWRTR